MTIKDRNDDTEMNVEDTAIAAAEIKATAITTAVTIKSTALLLMMIMVLMIIK